jgi:predicted RNA-binding protein with RPS1 domain
MSMHVGDVVTLRITHTAHYAVWGVTNGEFGFVHVTELAWERPIPDAAIPNVGDLLRAKVIYVVDRPQSELPLDVTADGRYYVHFAGSVKVLHPDPETAGEEPPSAGTGGATDG